MVEFDQSGLRRDRSEYWQQCLVVNLAETDPTVADMVRDPDWGEYWDLCLEQTLSLDWSKASYHSDDNNCFTFVLTFLRMLNQHPFTGRFCWILTELLSLQYMTVFTDWSSSKVNFCQKLILPKTVLAGKFIMLYRKLIQNNGLIVV